MSTHEPTLVAVGVLRVNGKLALIQFKRNVLAGYWGLPGGKIDKGETTAEAVEREVFEEVDIRVGYKELLAVVDEEILTKKGKQHFRMMVCRVEPIDSVKTKRLEHEEGVVDWFSQKQILSRPEMSVPSDFEIITRIALSKERGHFNSQLDMSRKKPKLLKFEPTDSASLGVLERR